MSGVLNDKTFEGMLRDMRREIVELQRRQSGAPAGMTPIFPTPGSLIGAGVDDQGTILMSGAPGTWVQLPRIFRDDFRGYKIVFSIKSTGGTFSGPLFRLMRGNVMDADPTVYSNARASVGMTGALDSAFSSDGYGMLSNNTHTLASTGTMEVIAPYKSFERTVVTFSSAMAWTNSWGSSTYAIEVPQDGIAFQRGPSSVTTDGWVKVFGYR